MTFTLTGFNVLKREGIQLTTGFTATVNADLAVGYKVSETVTVSGGEPHGRRSQRPTGDGDDARGRRYHSHRKAVPKSRRTRARHGHGPDHRRPAGRRRRSRTISRDDANPRRAGRECQAIRRRNGYSGRHRTEGRTDSTSRMEITRSSSSMSVPTSAERETGGVGINMVPRDGGDV